MRKSSCGLPLPSAFAGHWRTAIWVWPRAISGWSDYSSCRQHLQLALRSCEGIEWNHPVLSHIVTYYALLLEREAAQLDAAARPATAHRP